MIVIDTSILLDFFDGEILDLKEMVEPYKLIRISPVVFHEVLRAYPNEYHQTLSKYLSTELLPPPTTEDWIVAARSLRDLYPLRKETNLAKMQNDILIALAARQNNAPVWSRDQDFHLICDYLEVPLVFH